MLYGAYHFRSVFEGPALLPPFKGSTFRGVFGTALKKVVCALKREQCTSCLLRDRCVYALVFESIPAAGPGQGRALPHPFVIEPPLSEQTEFRSGDHFDFCLILFGWANDYLPYFVYAFQEVGALGVGRHIKGKRGGFRLLEVISSEKKIFSADDGLLTSIAPTDLVLEPASGQNDSDSSIRTVLETPLRLKFQNRLHAELPFHVLARAMLRRVSSLENHFGGGEPVLDYRGMVSRAEQVRLTRSTIKWLDWRRYSNRQEQDMLMGGIVGEAIYQGNLAEFIPLIRYCEKVHIGKATTFGLGKINASML